MIQTEIKFVRVMEQLDSIREEMSDLGGEYNSIIDGNDEDDYINGKLTDEAENRLEMIDNEVCRLEVLQDEIQKELGLNWKQMEFMDSCITNRWEIYADMWGAEIISLVDIANGRV